MGNESANQTLTGEEARLARETSRQLSRALSNRKSVTLRLGGIKEEIKLPKAAGSLLVEILNELGKGKAVKVLAMDAEISTQQAADLLHVSRPFLINLLERKEIPFHRIGSHRRLRLSDVLAYKKRTDEQRMAALDELTQLSQDLGLGYD
jgi:excisionase family DNA binding protein